MVTANTGFSSEDAERLRSFERRQHDSLAATYHDFFTPVTTLAIEPLLETVRLHAAASFLMWRPGQARWPPKHKTAVPGRSVLIFPPA